MNNDSIASLITPRFSYKIQDSGIDINMDILNTKMILKIRSTQKTDKHANLKEGELSIKYLIFE